MAANIFGSRMSGFRQPWWHKIGNVFNDEPSADLAFERVGLNYHFVKEPLFYRNPETGAEMPSGKVALLRSPTIDDPIWREMNQVDADFGVIQHDDMAKMLDAKIYDGKSLVERWPIETVGALGKGETMFCTLDEKRSYQVKGDTSEIKRYFLISDGKGGNHALRIAVTHIRVVCQNTLDAALSSASRQIRFPHYANVAQDMETYVQIMAQLESAQEDVTKLFNLFAETTITDAQAKAAIRAVYVPPKMPNKLGVMRGFEVLDTTKIKPELIAEYQRQEELFMKREEHMALLRVASFERYQAFNADQPRAAGTAWALFNGLTETSDCRRGSSDADIASSVLFGERRGERSRAFVACAKLANFTLSKQDLAIANAPELAAVN